MKYGSSFMLLKYKELSVIINLKFAGTMLLPGDQMYSIGYLYFGNLKGCIS